MTSLKLIVEDNKNKKMEIKNIKNIVELYDVWKNSQLRVDSMDSPRELGYIKYFELNPENFLGAYINDKLIGTIVYFFDGRKASIYRLAVDKKYQNRGIATELIKSVENEIKLKGIDSVFCLIEDENIASKKFFEKNGYKTFSNIKYFIKQF